MKKHFIALTALLAVASFGVSTAHSDVGVSVSIGQPGFFGQIDIGDYYPRPQVLYEQPRVIRVEPAYQYAEPIYLRVPPGHAKRWASYCGRYNACGRPVYFVQDTWYQNVYAPRYQEYRQRGDDGRRYDRDYWDKHGGPQAHYDNRPGNRNDNRPNDHRDNRSDNHQNGGGHDRGDDDRGGHYRGHDHH